MNGSVNLLRGVLRKQLESQMQRDAQLFLEFAGVPQRPASRFVCDMGNERRQHETQAAHRWKPYREFPTYSGACLLGGNTPQVYLF